MNVKRYLKKCAEKDRQEILESEKGKSILRNLLEGNSPTKEGAQSVKFQNENNGQSGNSKQKTAQKCLICPDCGSTLFFNPTFARFMHENCEQLNCWYAANELGECVDNNRMRAERIAKFSF